MCPSCVEVLCLTAERAVDLSCVGRLELASCSGVSGAAFISVLSHSFGCSCRLVMHTLVQSCKKHFSFVAGVHVSSRIPEH